MTSCGTESSVNTNGTAAYTENKQNDNIQSQQINMQFDAIDPVPFDSTKLFDQHIPANENMIGSQSEMILNIAATPASNNANLSQQSQSLLDEQANVETFPQFSNFNQTASPPPPQHQQFHSANFLTQQPNAEMQLVDTRNADLAHLADQRNQELTNLLQVEKVRNQELSVKVTQQHSTIEELSRELNQLRQNNGTIHELQQQVNAHMQTVNILVGEKSDLTAKLQQKDKQLSLLESKCGEFEGRLKASRHRVSELEKLELDQRTLLNELETIKGGNTRLKQLHQETCDENTEIQQQLAAKTKEIDELKNVISSKCGELEMARVRIEQLTGGQSTQSNDTTAIDQNQNDQRILESERQIIELQNMISELTNDRDRTQQQYQTYVQHLTNETTTLNQRIQELTKTNEKLTKREESLVNHVQELEKQIQKQLSTQRRLAALRDDDDKQKPDETTNNKENASSDEKKSAEIEEKLKTLEKEKADLNVSFSTTKIL